MPGEYKQRINSYEVDAKSWTRSLPDRGAVAGAGIRLEEIHHGDAIAPATPQRNKPARCRVCVCAVSQTQRFERTNSRQGSASYATLLHCRAADQENR